MVLKIAFAGFRHGHIFSLYEAASNRDDLKIVATCEEDIETRKSLNAAGKINVSYSDFNRMIDEVECDIIAVGDYYSKRGSLIIRALQRNKHVISDKPVCTKIGELEKIEQLCKEKKLKLGCMLDLRDLPQFIGIREIIQNSAIGQVQAINFGGQHPLLINSRPSWYFEEGKHGGTINDIAIHAIDIIPWITGKRFINVNTARSWNAFVPSYPFFKDAAQMMMTMENGCGVLGDVSYFSPDSLGYSLPFYWRMTFWGEKGVAETSVSSKIITLALNGKKDFQYQELPSGKNAGYLCSFIKDIHEICVDCELNTETILQSSRNSLIVQQIADSPSNNFQIL